MWAGLDFGPVCLILQYSLWHHCQILLYGFPYDLAAWKDSNGCFLFCAFLLMTLTCFSTISLSWHLGLSPSYDFFAAPLYRLRRFLSLLLMFCFTYQCVTCFNSESTFLTAEHTIACITLLALFVLWPALLLKPTHFSGVEDFSSTSPWSCLYGMVALVFNRLTSNF